MPKKYNYTKKTGRPSTYKEEYIDKVDEYLKKQKDEWKKVIKYKGERSTGYEQKLKVNLPTRYSFSSFLGVSTTDLINWGKKYKKFFVALKEIEKEQKKRLIEMSLSNDYNSTIAKLILSANHGMREQVAIDHTTKGNKMPAVQVKQIKGMSEEDLNDYFQKKFQDENSK